MSLILELNILWFRGVFWFFKTIKFYWIYLCLWHVCSLIMWHIVNQIWTWSDLVLSHPRILPTLPVSTVWCIFFFPKQILVWRLVHCGISVVLVSVRVTPCVLEHQNCVAFSFVRLWPLTVSVEKVEWKSEAIILCWKQWAAAPNIQVSLGDRKIECLMDRQVCAASELKLVNWSNPSFTSPGHKYLSIDAAMQIPTRHTHTRSSHQSLGTCAIIWTGPTIESGTHHGGWGSSWSTPAR